MLSYYILIDQLKELYINFILYLLRIISLRFRGLDLIEYLKYGQRFETGIKTIPKKKKCKKVKWLSEEALQITVKTREAKSKGEKEKYTHLNAEF